MTEYVRNNARAVLGTEADLKVNKPPTHPPTHPNPSSEHLIPTVRVVLLHPTHPPTHPPLPGLSHLRQTRSRKQAGRQAPPPRSRSGGKTVGRKQILLPPNLPRYVHPPTHPPTHLRLHPPTHPPTQTPYSRTRPSSTASCKTPWAVRPSPPTHPPTHPSTFLPFPIQQSTFLSYPSTHPPTHPLQTVAERLVAEAQHALEQRKQLLASDLATLNLVEEQMTAFMSDMRRDGA